jgi:MSHA biogenesis protein MshP
LKGNDCVVKPHAENCSPQTVKRRSESGFSLVTAIFLLVVLASLGAMMVTFFTVQQQSSAKDVLGSRAYQAARTGIEWAAYNVSQQAAGTRWTTCPIAAAPVTINTFATGTLGGKLAAFNVVVACASAAFIEGPSTIYIYTISSRAIGVNGVNLGDANYLQRDISVKMGR